uniref:OTU domain-containing protein n=1 Tax=Percolomonas cosmopolitus TaxID=63605 RepID=A0A7S1PJJ9_9EUKA
MSPLMAALPADLVQIPSKLRHPDDYAIGDFSKDNEEHQEDNEEVAKSPQHDSSAISHAPPKPSPSLSSLQKYHRSQIRQFDLTTRHSIKKSPLLRSKKDSKEFSKLRSDLKVQLERQQKDELADLQRILDVSEEDLAKRQERQKEQKRLKAEKRRLKALEEQKEREKLIEQAQNDPNSAKNMENEAIRNLLMGRNQMVQEIQADGHCLYRAVADQLVQRRIAIPGGEHTERGVQERESMPTYSTIRRIAAEYLRKHQEDYLPFLGLENDSEYEGYVDKVENSAEWGGQIELQALAHALNVPIRVIQSTQPNEIAIDPVEKSDMERRPTPIFLTYHKHLYASGEHYNSVRDTRTVLEEDLGEDEGEG